MVPSHREVSSSSVRWTKEMPCSYYKKTHDQSIVSFDWVQCLVESSKRSQTGPSQQRTYNILQASALITPEVWTTAGARLNSVSEPLNNSRMP